MHRLAISMLLGLWAAHAFPQAKEIERKMTLHFSETLEHIEKKGIPPDSVKDLVIWNYDDTIFPSQRILRFHNLQVLSLMGRPVRRSRKAKPLPPEELRIDTTLLGQMGALKVLQLTYFDMRWFPDGLLLLRNLQGLSLNLCLLNSLPDGISAMQGLDVLDVTLNYLNDLPPSIAQLHRLKVLKLGNNHFRSLPGVVLQMDSLQVLELGNREGGQEWNRASFQWPYPTCINHFDWEADTDETRQLIERPQLRRVTFPRDECSDPLYFKRAFPQKRSALKVRWDAKPQPCPDLWPMRAFTRYEVPMKTLIDRGKCLCGLKGL